MTFKDFAQCAESFSTRKILLQGTLAATTDDAALLASLCTPAGPPLAKRASLLGGGFVVDGGGQRRLGAAVCDDLKNLVRWEWLAAGDGIQGPFGGSAGCVHAIRLSAGCRDGLLPAHSEESEALLCQVRGCRRVLLLSPEQSYKGLYPYPIGHPYEGQAMVDLDAPDPGQWPLLPRLTASVTVLHPGELLLVPPCWWRHLQDLEPQTLGLELLLAPGPRRPRPECAVPRDLGRFVESRAVALMGLAGARRWLRAVAAAKEREGADLATPEGYKRVRAGSAIRDEIMEQLAIQPRKDDNNRSGVAAARPHWAEFLCQLTDRRMLPTPWLNTNFREPLYLLGAARPAHAIGAALDTAAA